LIKVVSSSSEEVKIPLSKTKSKSTIEIKDADWPKILESLKPKIDDENAAPIVQRKLYAICFLLYNIFGAAPGAGKVSFNVQEQIVGGVDAALGQFPWQAYIYIDGIYLCGGSLILANWIMTAAHCVQG